MIRKLFKRLGILLGIIILIPIILIIIGTLLLPKDKVKEQVVAHLTAATGAEVVLGEPSVRWWPQLAVSLDGGSISGTGEALTAATGSDNKLKDYQVQLSDFKVRLELPPLLSKRIEVGQVKVAGPSLQVAWEKGEMLAEDFQLEISDLGLVLAETTPEIPAVGKQIPPGEKIPEELVLSFAGQVGRLTLQKVLYDEVVFQGDLDTRIFTLESFQARRSTGLISGSGEIDYERDPWGELDFEVRAESVPASSLFEPWVPDLGRRLTGDLDSEVSLTCNLKDQETIRSSLSLNGDLGCGEGVLAAADWLRDVSPYLGDRQDLKNISFSSLTHAFRVDGGKYILENLSIDGHDTDWVGRGWVGLDGTIDAALQVKLPPGFTPDLGQWSFLADTLRDQDGRVNLDLHLTGMAAKPKVGLNLGNLQGGATEGAAEAVKKGLGGLLDKLKTR